MIYNFPKPYNEEIFYSVVARYIEYYGVGGYKRLLNALFSGNNNIATIDFPSRLSEFCSNVKNIVFSEDYIIYNHTLFLYYSHFINPKKNERIKDSMRTTSGDIHTRVGLVSGIFSPLQLPRFCRKCYDEDIKYLGESYFRREHQIPSVPICVKHNIFLEELPKQVKFLNKQYFIPASIIEDYPKVKAKVNDNPKIKEISERACSLLKHESIHIYNHQEYFYNQKFKELGFHKYRDIIDTKSLYDAFENYYSPQVLLTFKSQVDFNSPFCWLRSIVRKHNYSFDPIRHILIEKFILSFNQESYPTKINSEKWPCLNPVCEHYNKEVISKYKSSIDYKSKREIKYIECSCGYGYSESYLQNKGVIFRRVKNYGPLWKKELKSCVLKGYSIKKTAEILNCDWTTVKSLLLKKCSKSKTKDNRTLIIKKKQWQNLINQNPQLSRFKLSKKYLGLFTYIYRKDKEWLAKQKYSICKQQTNKRIDWEKRDSEYLLLIMEKFNYLKNSGFNERVTKTLLISLTGKGPIIDKKYSTLPLTRAFIESVIESFEDFRIRRLKSAQMKLIKKNIEITRLRLLREAKIREEYWSSKIEKVVDDLLNSNEIKDKNFLLA